MLFRVSMGRGSWLFTGNCIFFFTGCGSFSFFSGWLFGDEGRKEISNSLIMEGEFGGFYLVFSFYLGIFSIRALFSLFPFPTFSLLEKNVKIPGI